MDKEQFPPHTRVADQEITTFWAEKTLKGQYSLLPYEEVWKDRASLLAYYGYALRPRYREGWIPSWLGTDINPFFCEDSIDTILPQIMYATRTEDGQQVCIKSIDGWTSEIKIACFLSSEELANDPRNPAVPILDVFSESEEGGAVLLVMPVLRPFDDPPFTNVGEVVDFVVQILAGLAFLHHYGIAHRDCCAQNIMMHGDSLYPHGFHPVRQSYSLSAQEELIPLTRTERPVKYHFIDFEVACWFPDDHSSRLVVGIEGRDREVPELSRTIPYDPFKVDIFTLGNVFRELHEKYRNIDFLQPLVEGMMEMDPAHRPTASQAAEWFESIQHNLRTSQLEVPLMLRKSLSHHRELSRDLRSPQPTSPPPRQPSPPLEPAVKRKSKLSRWKRFFGFR